MPNHKILSDDYNIRTVNIVHVVRKYVQLYNVLFMTPEHRYDNIK